MGGGSSRQPYTPPPVTPMPIEDSIATKQEAAKLASARESEASRSANDLNEQDASKSESVTRKQLGMPARLARDLSRDEAWRPVLARGRTLVFARASATGLPAVELPDSLGLSR